MSDGVQQSVVHDRWDRQDLAAARKAVRPFQRARKTINDVTPTGTEALDDAFYVLLKADPHQMSRHEMKPSFLVNHWVINELMQLPATRRLRLHTVGDLVSSATACVSLAHTLRTIFEKLELAIQAAQKLALLRDKRAALQDHLDEAREAFDEVIDQAPSMRKTAIVAALKEMEREMSCLKDLEMVHSEGLETALRYEAPVVSLALNEAMEQLDTAAHEQAATTRAWGTSQGQLQRLSPTDRLALAKTLNNKRMREIAALFGRMENLSLSAVSEDIDDIYEEVHDLQLGSDLARIVPAELLLYGHADTELAFLTKWADGELLQYQVKGEDSSGRGGIVMCIDGSLSMRGSREIFAKALMLFLIHEARRQHRLMHVIHFGYHQTKHISFKSPADFTAEQIIDATESFWASGTDFEQPMTEALALLRAEFNATSRTRSDVVFVSDDEYYLDQTFLAGYLASAHEMKARTWGVLVDQAKPDEHGPLWQMSEGRVASAKDLTSGRDIGRILAGVR